MLKSMVYKLSGGGGDICFNMTPMIDVVFLLIIFFILASQMASQELVQLKLHRPQVSQARRDAELTSAPNRLIVNVVWKGDTDAEAVYPALAGQARTYRIGVVPVEVGDQETLVDVFTARRKAAEAAGHKEFFVEIRADYRVNFGDVAPVMLAAAAARIPKMNITALLEAGD